MTGGQSSIVRGQHRFGIGEGLPVSFHDIASLFLVV